MTLRATAKEIGISLATAFAWRHKLLGKMQTNTNTIKYSATIQEITLPYSEKGTRKKTNKQYSPDKSLLLSDTAGNTAIIQLPQKHRKLKTLQILINTKHQKSTTSTNLQKQQKNEILTWLEHFRGVASKYLQHYWNWQTLLENLSHRTDQFIQIKYLALCR